MKPTWILFADASNARLYQSQAPGRDLSLLRELSHPESRAKGMGLGTDPPGRGREGGTSCRLILVAAPESLGRLRRQLSERVSARIVAEVEKDYLHLEPREL